MNEAILTKKSAATLTEMKQERPKTILQMLNSEGFREQLKAALPSFMRPEKVARIAITEIRSNPKLLQCDALSLMGCIMRSSQLGLDIDSLKGHAYLVPYKNECQLIIGYKGMLSLAMRSGKLSSVEVQEVHENDVFELEHGDNYGLRHKINPRLSERGAIVGYYAYAHLVNGGKHFEYMNLEEIEAIKACSKGSTLPPSPWQTFPSEMAKKTVIRRLCKYLSLSPEMDAAIAIDELVDTNLQTQKNRQIAQKQVEPADFEFEMVNTTPPEENQLA